MPWILKAVLLAARSRRGRELLFSGMLAAIELAESERMREAYGKVQARLAGLRPRGQVSGLARKVRQHTKL